MSEGMQQFHEHFLAESLEALSVIESLLLQMSAQDDNAEQLAKVFRLAHSIKGGAAMCGFSQVAAYTHSLETLLDALRNHRVALGARASDALLQSVDVLREMLGSTQAQQPGDVLRHDAVHAELVALGAGDVTCRAGMQLDHPAQIRDHRLGDTHAVATHHHRKIIYRDYDKAAMTAARL